MATLWPLARTQATLDDVSFADFKPSVVVNSTGLTDAVQWDGYSLYVEGTRAIIFSGEVHRKCQEDGITPDKKHSAPRFPACMSM